VEASGKRVGLSAPKHNFGSKRRNRFCHTGLRENAMLKKQKLEWVNMVRDLNARRPPAISDPLAPRTHTPLLTRLLKSYLLLLAPLRKDRLTTDYKQSSINDLRLELRT